MVQNLRFAVRSLVHARGFAAAAILTLGVGIGATTIVYSIVDGLLLRPLPYGERAGRLVTIHSTHPTETAQTQMDDAGVSYADVVDFRAAAMGFEAIEVVGTRSVSLASDAESERVAAASVTTGLFRMLGVAPALGRDFEEADGARAGFEQVAIISDGLWKRLYASDPAVVGKSVLLNGRALTIAGVMPPRFDFPEGQQIWLPLSQERGIERDRRGGLMGVGLVRAGVSVEQAREELNSVASALAAQYPETNRSWSAHVAPMRDLFVSDGLRLGLASMFTAVALVLLAACANIAGLLVARGIGRQRELTVRAALGASRGDLVRLLLTESAMLSVLGGGAGLLIAAWGLRALMASMPEPPPLWASPAIDVRALVFTALASAACALAAGLVPALRVSRVRAAGSLTSGARSLGPSADQRRLQSLLVAAQVAMSLVLIVGAALLARSVMRLQHADAGFNPAPLASLRFYIAGDAYDDAAPRARAVARVLDNLEALPGVRAAAITGSIPADDGAAIVRIETSLMADPAEGIGASAIPVSARFWDAMGLQVDGRTFTQAEIDAPDGDVVIVSRALAARLWPGESAADRVFHVRQPEGRRAFRVIGVSPDMVYEEIGEETEQSRFVVYVPHSRTGYRYRTLAAILRVDGDPATVLQPSRAAVRGVDPAFATFDTLTMAGRRATTQWSERFMGRTFGVFAGMGLLLACLGAYGLTAYSAAQRAREIGVRLAIGATRADILRLLLTRGVRLALAGALVGLPLAALAASAMRGMLFEISPWDPALWATVPLLLVAVVLLASYLPAHRASGADPARALRAD